MKQALIALLRDTFTGKSADALRTGETRQSPDSAPRVLDLREMRMVAGGDGEVTDSPKRGWSTT